MNITRMVLTALCALSGTQLHARHFYQPHRPALTRHNSSMVTGPVTMHTYSSSYMRSADEAFAAHGIRRKPLSSLYFGKSDFRLSNMFKNSLASLDTKNYTPYVRILKMHPRVQYREFGTHLGLTAYTHTKNGRGRIGVRVDVPVMRREVERKDHGSRGPATTQDLVNEQSIKIDKSGGDDEDYRIDRAHTYRLDFLEALPKNTQYESAVTYGSSNTIQVFDRSLHEVSEAIGGAFLTSPESYVPRGENVGVAEATTGKTTLPTDLSSLSPGTVYYALLNADYSDTADAADKTIAKRLADQDLKATVWLVPTFDDVDTLSMNTKSKSIQASMNDALKDFNANQFEWMHDRDYALESAQDNGLGDITIEFFSGYDWEKLSLNGCTGVILPTANGTTQMKNPYEIHLGYRKHTIAFAGLDFDYALGKSNVTLSGNAKYSTALGAEEHRCAMPVGAQIKNMGPVMPVRSSWQFIDAGLLFTLQHPYTAAISLSGGYQFYYKTRDSLAFGHTSVESWLGATYNATTKKFSTANTFVPNEVVSTRHTQSISHSLTGKLNYRISDWMRISGGGSYVIAGKNCPQTIEAHLSCVVAF